MEYSNQDIELDVNTRKIKELEKELHVTRELLTNCIDSLKETQRFIMKLAYNQSEITKRVSSWPYIVVSSSKDDDEQI
jgi:hypothetical protein